jgi:ABC-2 type transport system ATP-binding protein
VKSRFGRNTVGLRLTGGDQVLADVSLVSNVARHNDHVEALLAEGASAQQLLEKLVAGGASIEKFEMIEPSLHDIFIQKVTETV